MKDKIFRFLFIAGAGTINQIGAFVEGEKPNFRVLRHTMKRLEEVGLVKQVGKIKFQVLGRPQDLYTLTNKGKSELGFNLKEKVRGETSLTRCIFRAEYMIHNRECFFPLEYQEREEICREFGIKWNGGDNRVISDLHGTVIALDGEKLQWGVPLLQYRSLSNVITSVRNGDPDKVEVCILCRENLERVLNKRIKKFSLDAVPRTRDELVELFNQESDPHRKEMLFELQRGMTPTETKVLGFDFSKMIETFSVSFEYLNPQMNYA